MLSPEILAKTFDKIDTTMYHGTNSNHYSSLVSGINVVQQFPNNTDFGDGFYLTSDINQASKHAIKRARFIEADPIVFIYELDVESLRNNFSSKICDKMNETWAEFIYDNRSIKFQKRHNFDFVYGGVADGSINSLIKTLDNDKIETGKVNFQFFLESIANYLYDQLSLHNQNIITSNIIKLIRVVSAHDTKRDYIETQAV